MSPLIHSRERVVIKPTQIRNCHINESLPVKEDNFSFQKDGFHFILLNLIFLYSHSYARISLSAYVSMMYTLPLFLLNVSSNSGSTLCFIFLKNFKASAVNVKQNLWNRWEWSGTLEQIFRTKA